VNTNTDVTFVQNEKYLYSATPAADHGLEQNSDVQICGTCACKFLCWLKEILPEQLKLYVSSVDYTGLKILGPRKFYKTVVKYIYCF